MPIDFTADPVPLRYTEHGGIRVGTTRVSLDSVLYAFKSGETPETIVQNFDTLKLADVYAVIAFYLRRRPELDAYLAEQERLAEELRQEIEAKYPTAELWARIKARAAAQRATA